MSNSAGLATCVLVSHPGQISCGLDGCLHSYRLCPANATLTEECFQQHHLEFDREAQVRTTENLELPRLAAGAGSIGRQLTSLIFPLLCCLSSRRNLIPCNATTYRSSSGLTALR